MQILFTFYFNVWKRDDRKNPLRALDFDIGQLVTTSQTNVVKIDLLKHLSPLIFIGT
ncbi:hypothetical protein ACX0G7_03655 [Flavitalea antarctica]